MTKKSRNKKTQRERKKQKEKDKHKEDLENKKQRMSSLPKSLMLVCSTCKSLETKELNWKI